VNGVCFWPQAPARPVLTEAEIHIWCADLDQPAVDYAALLSVDEQARAQRFLLEQARQRFIAGRGMLRVILARYLGVLPQQVQIETRAAGKPALAAKAAQARCCFNLSHSENLVLYAISLEREVGIDLEYMNPACDTNQLVEQFFSEAEKREWDSLPASQRLEAFFTGWTRKEAYLKARGEGLAFPLAAFSVGLAPGEPARLIEPNSGREEPASWRLQTLEPAPAPGYAAALAFEGQACQIWQWCFGG
jgi:4'-phosphopantetheinyl transferase